MAASTRPQVSSAAAYGAPMPVATADVAAGSKGHVDVFYDNSPVFTLTPDAQSKGVKPVAWFDSSMPLRSGWGWGQDYLEGGVAMATAKVGKGQMYIFGPEVLFRGQPHGTFKFLFNSIYYGTAQASGIAARETVQQP